MLRQSIESANDIFLTRTINEYARKSRSKIEADSNDLVYTMNRDKEIIYYKGNYSKNILKNFNNDIKDTNSELYNDLKENIVNVVNLGIVGYQGYKPLWVVNTDKPKRVKGRKLVNKFAFSTDYGESRHYDTLQACKKAARLLSAKLTSDYYVFQFYDNGDFRLVGTMEMAPVGNFTKTFRTVKDKKYLPVYRYELIFIDKNIL